MSTRIALGCAALVALSALGFQQASPQKMKIYQDLKDQVAGPWVYDDLAQGTALAQKSGKPMLVVFR